MALRRRQALGSLVTLAVGGTLAGCAGQDGGDGQDGGQQTDAGGNTQSPGATAAGEPTTLPVAHIQGTTQAPISVGLWKDLFQEHGIELDERAFVRPADMYRNVQTGSLDFVYGVSPLVAARAYIGGQDIRLIRRDVRTFQKLIGPKDVTDPQDLEGERVGGYASSSSTNFAYHVAFDELYGVDYNEFYDARELAPPVGVSQLEKGEIQAFWTHPPWTSKLLASGDYGVVATAADLYEEATGHTLHTADGATQVALLENERDTLESFYDAIAEAAELIEDDPETSLTESGYTELFEFSNDAELAQFVDEVAGLFVKEYDVEAYVEDVSFMFEEAASRGYIESVPDEGIFDLI